MLPKSHKLNSVEFKAVFDGGKTIHTDHFMVKTVPQTDHSRGLQAAVVVSKKISKKAVDRNRLRRQIFAALEPHKTHPHRMILILKPKGYEPFKSGELVIEIKKTLQTLNTKPQN